MVAVLILLMLFGHGAGCGAQQLVLIQGHSRVLYVPNLTRAAVGDPTIVDVGVIDSGQVLLNPLQTGSTSLHLWTANSQQIYQLRVAADDGTLTKEFLTALNLPEVSAWFADQYLVLEGRVRTEQDLKRAEKLAEAYSDSVISLLYVSEENSLERELRRLLPPEIKLTIFNNTAIFEGQIDDEGVRALAYRTADAFGLQVLDLLKVGNADPVPESTAAEVTEPGPADFAEQIQALLDDNVHVYAVGETIFLEGSAADEYHRRRACAIAEAYGLPVVDLIRVQERSPEVEPLDVDDLESDEETLLSQMNRLIGSPEITLEIVYGHLVLEGRAVNLWEKERAVKLAAVSDLPVIDLITVEMAEENPTPTPAGEVDEPDRELLNTLLAGTDIHPHWIGSTLFLEGTAEDEFAKTRALAIGQAFSDQVIDLVRVQPPPIILDSGNEHVFEADLVADIASALREPGISVRYYHGTIVLEGLVPDQKAKERAERLAEVFYQPVISFLQYPQPGQISSAEELVRHLDLPDVKVTAVGEKLVLEGTVQNSREHSRVLQVAELYGDVIDLLTILEPEQVLLQVHVVELDRSAGEQFGVEWGSLVEGQLFANVISFEEVAHIGSWQMNRSHLLGARLSALEEEGKAKLLAAPSLLTLSGEPAEFLAGGEIPVLVQVGDQQTIEWIVYGVKLEILPFIADEQIRIQIKPEVSSLDWQTSARLQTSMPPLRTRRTETVVNLKHGSTAVIGGLIQHEENNQIKKIPILGDLPIIGALFRSSEFQERQTELTVFVTPWIVSEGVSGDGTR